ncbi:hypothetical protein KC355_g16274 [Hortaea werneckii]|nr:hypothetical protein KC355_g16274 [Hortaea werneckii]
MARFSRNKSSMAQRPTVSPWMTAFYICAILLAPMVFMGMIPSAHADENVQDPSKDSSVSGPANSAGMQSLVSIWEPPTLASVS